MAVRTVPTVEINRNGNKVIINESDFDSYKDMLWDEQPVPDPFESDDDCPVCADPPTTVPDDGPEEPKKPKKPRKAIPRTKKTD